MENESKVWRNVIIISVIVAVVIAVLASVIRTEQRFFHLVGMLRDRLPKKRQNHEFCVELEDI